MSSTQTFRFTAPPSTWGLYPRILAARKPAWVRDGATLPRIEAALPHVLASPLHLSGCVRPIR